MTYTDYPEADIKTHRDVAKVTIVLSAVFVFTGIHSYGVVSLDNTIALTAMGGLGLFSATRMLRQADRWEDDLRGDER